MIFSVLQIFVMNLQLNLSNILYFGANFFPFNLLMWQIVLVGF